MNAATRWARPSRLVVAERDPREHRARAGCHETLCGAPVLIDIQLSGWLAPCPHCHAADRKPEILE